MTTPLHVTEEQQAIKTICPFCGVGCGMALTPDANGKLLRVEPDNQHPISAGQLCTKGWNTGFAIDPNDRIKTPLIKEGTEFRQASWDEALTYITDEINNILEVHGNNALGVISSARATNEDNYAAQKFARAVLGTNNIDHCARICHSPTVAGLSQTLGSGAMTNSVCDVDTADVIVVFGADPTTSHTIIGGRIIRAKNRGAKLIVVDPRQTQLARLADLHLQLHPGTNISLINGLLKIIFDNQWEDKNFLTQRCENTDQLKEHIQQVDLNEVAKITGVKVKDLKHAAEIYSHANAAFLAYGMGITQYMTGTNNVIALSNLVLTCGHIGKPGTGINPLRGQNNVQGACDMGCLPNVFPGYQAVTDHQSIEKFTSAWHIELSVNNGLTSLGMTKSALENTFKGLIIVGEDPVVTDPDQNHVKQALAALDLLVVCELTMTETAKMADVVLPAVSFAEKNGTFTNCERRVQKITKVLANVGEAKADWKIFSELAQRLNYAHMNWQSEEEIFDEMAALTTHFSGMTYSKIEKANGLQWPCNASHPQGSNILHQESFPTASGKANLIPVHHMGPAETVDEQYPLVLTTNRLHFHYGCGSMSRKSPLLERETPAGILFINSADAQTFGISQEADVIIRSRRGEVCTKAIITDQVPEGLVSMPYHFKEAPSNRLTNTAQDPVTKMPELKACAVSVEAINKEVFDESL